MAAKFAFFPPNPSFYGIGVDESTGKNKITGVSTRGNVIVALYIKNTSASLTLLYSHGKAADLGQMYELFSELSINLQVNFLWCLSKCLNEVGRKDNKLLTSVSAVVTGRFIP